MAGHGLWLPAAARLRLRVPGLLLAGGFGQVPGALVAAISMRIWPFVEITAPQAVNSSRCH